MPSNSNNSAFSHDEFAKALSQHDYLAEKGQVVHGKICQLATEGVYVDFGGKSPGFVSLRELGANPTTDLEASFPLDSEWDFLVTSEQNSDGQVRLSRRQLQIQAAWDNLQEYEESGKIVEIYISGTNRGGVTGDIEGVRGFIPRSHLMEKENLDSLIGQTLKAQVIEANLDTNKLVLSQRQIQQVEAMAKIAPGMIVPGKVVKIQPYGVFVDMDGVSGLLHISQVSGIRIDDLSTIFQFGQELRVYIQDIDDYKNRISLSTRSLEMYPGELLEKFEELMADAPNRLSMIQAKLEMDASVSPEKISSDSGETAETITNTETVVD